MENKINIEEMAEKAKGNLFMEKLIARAKELMAEQKAKEAAETAEPEVAESAE